MADVLRKTREGLVANFDKNMLKLLIDELVKKQKIKELDAKALKYINNLVVKEYVGEYING